MDNNGARMTEVILGYTSKRRVEYYTVLKMIFGKMPVSIYGGVSPMGVYSNPLKLVTQDEWEGLSSRPVMKDCSNCGEVFPEDGNMWERNSRGLNGWHSHCKNCRREYYQRRYQSRKANRKYRLPA